MSTKQDIKKLLAKLVDIQEELTKKSSMEDLGEEAAELIRKRTRLGYGVEKQGGSKKKLKKLSPSYKEMRKKHKPAGPTTAAKSNLTYSGEMLDDLQAVKAKEGTVEVGFKNKDAKDKAGWVSKDRPFNNLSKAEKKQLQQLLKEKLEKAIKKS